MRLRLMVAMWLLVTALALVSCGGAEEATPTRPPAPPPPTVAPTATQPPPTVAAPQPTATPRPAATSTPIPTPRPAATPTVAAAARQGAKVVAAVDDLGSEVFLTYHSLAPDKALTDVVYDHLLYYDLASGQFRPGLVESWKIEQNGLKWTMKLREGVKFSDGTEFTSADVKFQLEKTAAPGSRFSFQATWNAAIGTVTATGKYEVVVNFKKLFAGFAQDVSNYQSVGVMSKSYLDRVGENSYDEKPVGTGPYTMESRTRGFSYRFRAIERHWRLGVPGFRELEIQKVPEAATRLAALRTGAVDAVPMPLDLAKQVDGLKGLRLISAPGAYAMQIYLVGTYPAGHPKLDPKVPFLKLEVRKALNLAVNRKEIVDTLLGGKARVATWVPYLVPGWQDVVPYPYDPAQAKRLLADAGYPEGFTMTAYRLATVPEGPPLLDASCAYWAQIGVKCEIRPTDFGSWFPRWRNFDLAGTVVPYHTPPRPDYETGMAAVFGHKQFVPVAWDKEMGDLIDRLSTEGDPGARLTLFRQIAQIVYDRYLVVALAVVDALVTINEKISPDWRPTQTNNPIGGWETLGPPR